MKVLEEIKVSVYENVYSKKPRVMSFLEVIIMCIHPIYASIINAIRRYYAEGDRQAHSTERTLSKTFFSPAILSDLITIM